MTTQIHTVDGHDLCRVHVRPCGLPVDATVVIDNKGNLEKKKAFVDQKRHREITDEAERQKKSMYRCVWAPSQDPLPS